MMLLGSFIISYEKIPHARKAQKAQKATFFILDFFMRTKSIKSSRHQISNFLPFRCFCVYKNAVFFYLYSSMCILCFLWQISNFLPFRCFLYAFKTVFCFYSFVCVWCVWGLFERKYKAL